MLIEFSNVTWPARSIILLILVGLSACSDDVEVDEEISRDALEFNGQKFTLGSLTNPMDLNAELDEFGLVPGINKVGQSFVFVEEGIGYAVSEDPEQAVQECKATALIQALGSFTLFLDSNVNSMEQKTTDRVKRVDEEMGQKELNLRGPNNSSVSLTIVARRRYEEVQLDNSDVVSVTYDSEVIASDGDKFVCKVQNSLSDDSETVLVNCDSDRILQLIDITNNTTKSNVAGPVRASMLKMAISAENNMCQGIFAFSASR